MSVCCQLAGPRWYNRGISCFVLFVVSSWCAHIAFAASCVYNEAPFYTLEASQNYSFEQSGLRCDILPRWPSGRVSRSEFISVELAKVFEASNVVLVPTNREEFSRPVIVQEYNATSTAPQCRSSAALTSATVVMGDGLTANRTQIRTTYVLDNGAEMDIIVAHYDRESFLNFGGIPVATAPHFAKFTFIIRDWPFQNKTSNVMVINLDIYIVAYGLKSFSPGWIANSSGQRNRTYGIDLETSRGLQFHGELQMWASVDDQYAAVYPKSRPDAADISFSSLPDGRIVQKLRMHVGFLPFNRSLEWDPNFFLLLTGDEPPVPEPPFHGGLDTRSPSGSSDAVLTNSLMIYIVPPVAVVVVVIIVVSVILMRRRYAAQTRLVRQHVASSIGPSHEASEASILGSKQVEVSHSTPTDSAQWARAARPPTLLPPE